LLQAAELVFMSFTSRCLPFGGESARHNAKIITFTKQHGHPLSVDDAQIVAISVQNSALLATRNTTDFDFLENVNLINPWLHTTT
jgi:predicted nucleic acid-binding protein